MLGFTKINKQVWRKEVVTNNSSVIWDWNEVTGKLSTRKLANGKWTAPEDLGIARDVDDFVALWTKLNK